LSTFSFTQEVNDQAGLIRIISTVEADICMLAESAVSKSIMIEILKKNISYAKFVETLNNKKQSQSPKGSNITNPAFNPFNFETSSSKKHLNTNDNKIQLNNDNKK